MCIKNTHFTGDMLDMYPECSHPKLNHDNDDNNNITGNNITFYR